MFHFTDEFKLTNRRNRYLIYYKVQKLFRNKQVLLSQRQKSEKYSDFAVQYIHLAISIKFEFSIDDFFVFGILLLTKY